MGPKGNPFAVSGAAARVDILEAVQIDPVARVGRNQDLVLLARDSRHRSHMLDEALQKRQVFEYRANEASVIPTRDYPAFEGVRRRWNQALASELRRYSESARAILNRIASHGALPSRDFHSEKRVYGYWDTTAASTKETSHVINLLVDTGQLMVVKREGTTRYFDVPAQVIDREVIGRCQEMTAAEADDLLFDKYLRAYRLINGKHSRLGWNGHPAGIRQSMLKQRLADGRLVSVVIDGLASPYYVLAEDREDLQKWDSSPRHWRRPIRFLPPLDNLLWDRQRLLDLFDFHYRWEVYIPAAKRRFGVYAMPVLMGDRLVGRIDPEVRRGQEMLVVHNTEWEQSIRATPAFRAAVSDAVRQWGETLGVAQVVWETPGMDA